MTQIKSDFNGIVMAKPSHLSEKEWSETAHSLKQSHGGRLFSNHEHREASKGAMGVPDSPHMEFAADKAKRERKAKAEQDSGSTVE